jgi:hypothetical protein
MINQKADVVEKMLANVSKVEEQSAQYKIELVDLTERLAEMTRIRDETIVQNRELQLKLLTQQSSSSLEFELASLKK